jgi:GH15 family glucan-1,4-alpha-glucosidase
MGNPWFVTTLWIAQYYLQTDQEEDARKLVAWTLGRALPSGALGEQINPTTGEPLSVLPLVWSHAELINTLLDLYG